MKTVIEMAREAGFEARRGWWVRDQVPEDIFAASVNITTKIEAFAELVRADEREKYKWDVHSCGPTCTKAACVAMREAVKAEREACAKRRGVLAFCPYTGRPRHPSDIASDPHGILILVPDQPIRAKGNT